MDASQVPRRIGVGMVLCWEIYLLLSLTLFLLHGTFSSKEYKENENWQLKTNEQSKLKQCSVQRKREVEVTRTMHPKAFSFHGPSAFPVCKISYVVFQCAYPPVIVKENPGVPWWGGLCWDQRSLFLFRRDP